MLWFKKKRLVGLDIGSTSVKIAELDVGRKGVQLLNFAMQPTPTGAFSGGDIVSPPTIGAVIAQLLLQINTKRKLAAVGLGGSSVIVKRIAIPRMDEALIEEQLKWEAEQYVPYDINEVNLDYQILPQLDPESDNMDLLLIAAIQTHVFKYVSAAQEGGLETHVVDVNGFALANCFRLNYGPMTGNSIALINIGAGATNVTIYENGSPVFSRDIPIGGLTYTQDLSSIMSVSLEDAESIKLGMSAGEIPDEALSCINSTHEIIVDELKGTFEFFQNTSRTHGINRAFVTGGGCSVPGLLEALQSLTPTELMNPFENVNVSGKLSPEYVAKIKDFAAIAIGLGIREVET